MFILTQAEILYITIKIKSPFTRHYIYIMCVLSFLLGNDVSNTVKSLTLASY